MNRNLISSMILALAALSAAVLYADGGKADASGQGSSSAYMQAHLAELQSAVSQSVGKNGASVINAALGDYFSESGTAKSAAYTALSQAIDTYISDQSAKATLLQSAADSQAGKEVKSGEVANALLRGGLNTTIDNSSKLSANEKTIAKGVVNQLAGIDGSLQTASIEALQHSLVKGGMSEEKAKAIGENLSAYVSDTKNTTALKTAASIELQYVVEKNMGKKEAAVVNAAISEYLEGNKGATKEAALNAVQDALNKYVTDESAKQTLLSAVEKTREGKNVNVGEVGNALLRGGLNSAIDANKDLSANEKTIAKGVVNQLAGIDGSLQTASIEALQHSLVKGGMSEEKARAIGENLSAYVSDTKNTTALKTAASIELQYVVEKNMGKKEAAVVNAAISEYLEGNKGAMKEAALNAVQDAVNKYVKDESAKQTLLSAVEKTREGKSVNVGEVGGALLRAGVMEAIDNIPGLTPEQKAAAKQSASDYLNGTKTAADVAKEAAGQGVAAALEKAGVSKDTAAQIGQGVTDVLKDSSNTGNLVAGGVNAAIEAIPGLTDEQRANAKEAASQVLSGEKTLGQAAAEKAGYAVTEALKAAGVKTETANEIGAGVDAYVKTGKTDALTMAGVNAAIDAIPGLTDEQRAKAKAAAASVISGDKSVADVAKENAGALVTEALKRAGVNPETAAEIGAGVGEFVNTGKTDALQKAAVNAAIDAIPGLTDEQKAAAKKAAADLMNDKSVADVAKEAVGDAVSKALERAGLSKESAEQIGKGVTDILKDPSNTDNLVKGGIGAAIDAIPGLTDAQREAVKQKVSEILAGTTTVGEAIDEATRKAIADALEKVGIDPETAKKIAGDVTGAVASLFDGTDADWGKLGTELVDAGKDILFGEGGLLAEWIDESDLPDEVKILAKGIIADLSGDDGALTAAGREALYELLRSNGVSDEDARKIADAAGEVARTWLDGEGFDEAVDNLIATGETILASAFAKAIDKQLDKLTKKFPFLKDLFGELGINGKSIVEFLRNLSWEKVEAAFQRLLNMTWEDWMEIGKKILDKILDKAIDKLCNYINAEIDKLLAKLLKKFNAAVAKIKGIDKYMSLVQFAGTMVTDVSGAELKTMVNQSGMELKKILSIGAEGTPGGGSGEGHGNQ